MNHENAHPHRGSTEETNNQETCAPEFNEAAENPVKEENPPMPPSVQVENEEGVSQPNVPNHEVLHSSEPDAEAEDKTSIGSQH